MSCWKWRESTFIDSVIEVTAIIFAVLIAWPIMALMWVVRVIRDRSDRR